MNLQLAVTVFATVLFAELGDKTQLATLLFAAKSPGSLVVVFVGASLALIVATGVGVLAGGLVSQYLSPKILSLIAGAGFIVIGTWTIWQGMVSP